MSLIPRDVRPFLPTPADLPAADVEPGEVNGDGDEPTDEETPMTTCTCTPCITPQHGAPGWTHCAACCGGSLIVDYDPGCPEVEHRVWARRQHGEGPLVAVDDQGPAGA